MNKIMQNGIRFSLLGLMVMNLYSQSPAFAQMAPTPPLPPSGTVTQPPNTPVASKKTSLQKAVKPASSTRRVEQSAPVLEKSLLEKPLQQPVLQEDSPSLLESTSLLQNAEESSSAVTIPTGAADSEALSDEPLADFYRENQSTTEQFTSSGYLFKLFGILGLLLAGFYFAVRFFWAPQHNHAQQAEPLVPFNRAPHKASLEQSPAPPTQSFLQKVFSGVPGRDKSAHPKVVSRTRLGANKEIHVIEIEGRRLVVGSTSQQMTLLTELSHLEEFSEQPGIVSSSLRTPPLQEDPQKEIYQKYGIDVTVIEKPVSIPAYSQEYAKL